MDAVKAGVAGGPSSAVTSIGGGISSDMLKLADRITEGLFIRGGIVTVASRTAADEARVIKFMLSPRGLIFIGKQYLLQSMNAMPVELDPSGAPGYAGRPIKASNTRLYFPGSLLASLPPGSHMVRHWGDDAVAMMANIDLGISKFVDGAGKISSFLEKNFPDLTAGIRGAVITIKDTISDVLSPLGEKLDSIAAGIAQSKLGQLVGKAGSTVGSIIGDYADHVAGRVFAGVGPNLMQRNTDTARGNINIYSPKNLYAGTSTNKYGPTGAEPRNNDILLGTATGFVTGKTKDNLNVLMVSQTKLYYAGTKDGEIETLSYEVGADSLLLKGSRIYHKPGLSHVGGPGTTDKEKTSYQTLAYEGFSLSVVPGPPT
jgi:hypothetical protein